MTPFPPPPRQGDQAQATPQAQTQPKPEGDATRGEPTRERPVRVVCVDDNHLVLEALDIHLQREDWLEIVALLPQADNLPSVAADAGADIVLLDLDMPGRDAFDAMAELARRRPEARTIIVSGHVRADLVDRALDSGAWGYLCKSAGTDVIVEAIRLVLDGEFAFGPDGLA